MKLKVLDLFSGIGGFSMGLGRTGGFETVAFCEIDIFCQYVLRKHWPDVPIYDDVRKLEYGGSVDVVCGGFPCQDISVCGTQQGLGGVRSGLWTEMFRIIGRVRPAYVIIENSPNLLAGDDGAWFSAILCDLASIGYDAEWECIRATAVGAIHERNRVWIIAYPNGSGVEGMDLSQSIRAYSEESRRWQFTRAIDACLPADDYASRRGNIDDVPYIMEQLKSYGNAVIPQIPEIIGRAILRSRERIK